VKKDSPENFLANAERLLAVRNELNIYVEELHRKYAGGYSLFELFCNYSELEKTGFFVYFSGTQTGNLKSEDIIRWDDLAGELETVATIIAEPAHHPLKDIHLQAYSQQIKMDVQALLKQILGLLSQFERSLLIVTSALGFNGNLAEQMDALGEFISILLQIPDSPPTFLTTESLEQTLAKVIGVAGLGKNRDITRSALLQIFTKNILEFPAEKVLAGWQIAEQKWFLPK